MKILIIANNIVGNYDGIGKHARIVGQELSKLGLNIDYSTGETWKFSKVKLLFSFEMSKAYINACKRVLFHKYDYVNIEYPFMEYNPMILFFHWILWFLTRFMKTKVSFSMHEHDRVKPIRRKVIDCMLPFADLVFISEDKYLRSLPRYARKMRVRTIPSHGIAYNSKLKDFKNNSRYCYFGLVNGSKAFTEMLDAWQVFNLSGAYTLDIVTNTDLELFNLDKYKGVSYHYKLSDEDSGTILSSCVFSIIPVLPSIGYNNSSFVSSVQCGCIPIGKFNQNLKNEPFVLNVEDYGIEEFCNVLNRSQNLTNLKQMSDVALKFGEQFSVSKTAKMMMDAFEEFKNEKNK